MEMRKTNCTHRFKTKKKCLINPWKSFYKSVLKFSPIQALKCLRVKTVKAKNLN